MSERIVITDGYTLNPGDLSWSEFSAFGDVKNYERTEAPAIAGRCADATIIITNKTPIIAATIRSCRNLKLIAVTATGYNIVDTIAAREQNVLVCNVPGYGTDSVAQHTFALLLELVNHVGIHSVSVKRGDWGHSKDFSYTMAPLVELAGKTLGIIGYGSIGRKVGEIASAFGMIVKYTRQSKDPRASTIEEVFQSSDFITLHCPLTKDNTGFVNAALISTMKKDACLVNTARGQLINEQDLADALRGRRIKSAALDVLAKEPPDTDNPLIGLSNCIITPHVAWVSVEARRRIMETTIQNIRSALSGKPINVVN